MPVADLNSIANDFWEVSTLGKVPALIENEFQTNKKPQRRFSIQSAILAGFKRFWLLEMQTCFQICPYLPHLAFIYVEGTCRNQFY